MPIYQNLPIITVQDPKHAKKTARNQLHSGARLLVLGNNVMLYRHLLTLAQAKNHAIYIRDVVNVDKQDDGAAYRLFHSDVLEQMYQNELENNEMQSLFVYLFVLGYIFDFNPNSISNENIDILRIWPDDNAIYDAIKTAYNDAAGFIKALGIKLLNDKTIPHFYVSTSHQSMVISDLSKNCNDDFDIDNISGLDFNNEEFELDNLNENSFTDAASEVARLSKLVDLTESELKQISDISDSSKVELNHILNTTKFSSLIEFQQNELFYTNGLMNVSQIIQIRTSHNAFSRSERPCQNRRLNAIQSSDNQEEFNRNSANLLISEFF
ncbi:hypothetical protein RhiirB3_501086 [Rhizophagus irregularis]|nr:hypothetical protein RhiirB3_501086 [Rhizophagus irregularis]